MPSTGMISCIPVRVKMRLQAAAIWITLCVPSIVVTLVLFVSGGSETGSTDNARNTDEQVSW